MKYQRANFRMSVRAMFIIASLWAAFFLCAGALMKCEARRAAEEKAKWKIYQ